LRTVEAPQACFVTSEPAAERRKEAAVLLPVWRDGEGRLRLVLVRRSAGGRHGGQLALPGGNREPGDADLLATALREAEEEIGLPRDGVEVVAELPPVDTRSTGFRVHPYLGRLTRPPGAWRLHAAEIAGVVDVAVADLAAPGATREELVSFPTWPQPRRTPVIPIGDELLWGVTLRIVEPVLPRLLAGEWEL
jgi:8-oxo-dGTP pyrophosphatase MutT (NUDIX family)